MTAPRVSQASVKRSSQQPVALTKVTSSLQRSTSVHLVRGVGPPLMAVMASTLRRSKILSGNVHCDSGGLDSTDTSR